MKKPIISMAAIIFIASMFIHFTPSEASAQCIEGTVKKCGVPQQGCTVSVYSGTTLVVSGTTDAQGFFKFCSGIVCSQSYTVVIYCQCNTYFYDIHCVTRDWDVTCNCGD